MAIKGAVRHVLHVLQEIGHQRSVSDVARHANLSTYVVRQSLDYLERRGLVNIHRVELNGRSYIRHIVPVDIQWRARSWPPTTAQNNG